VIASAACDESDFVYDFFSFCRGERGRVGFAWVKAAIAFARFFICSSSATCSFANAQVVIEKTRFFKLFSVQCCQNAVRIFGTIFRSSFVDRPNFIEKV
jgi:hypothetical protein